MAPSHYLNQRWNIFNWTLGNKLQWNRNQNSYIFIQENAVKNFVWKWQRFCLSLNVLMVDVKPTLGFVYLPYQYNCKHWHLVLVPCRVHMERSLRNVSRILKNFSPECYFISNSMCGLWGSLMTWFPGAYIPEDIVVDHEHSIEIYCDHVVKFDTGWKILESLFKVVQLALKGIVKHDFGNNEDAI